jgi:hypothetical protein
MMNAKSEKIYMVVKEFIEKTKGVVTEVMTLVQDPRSFDSTFNYIEASKHIVREFEQLVFTYEDIKIHKLAFYAILRT